MNKLCPVCGSSKGYRWIEPIDAELKRTWGISKNTQRLFNIREGGICIDCGSNIRAQGLAYAILLSKYGYGKNNLIDWVEEANKKKLSVCELNSCHEIHQILMKLNNLTYAEYGTPSEQDVQDLSYEDDMFDLVLHSETFEHVDDARLSMEECRRVIKPDGLVMFTVPIIWKRKTKVRAKIENGKLRYLLERSYHGKRTDDYLVYREFGRDIDELLGVGTVCVDSSTQSYVFVSGKSPAHISLKQKLLYAIKEMFAEINSKRSLKKHVNQ